MASKDSMHIKISLVAIYDDTEENMYKHKSNCECDNFKLIAIQLKQRMRKISCDRFCLKFLLISCSKVYDIFLNLWFEGITYSTLFCKGYFNGVKLTCIYKGNYNRQQQMFSIYADMQFLRYIGGDIQVRVCFSLRSHSLLILPLG